MAVIGYLDNLCFDEGATKIGSETGVETPLIRKMMIQTVQNLFEKANIPYIGPITSTRYPLGGFFFKAPGKLERVLPNLGINDSMKVRIEGHKFHDISLGIIVKDFPNNENPTNIDSCEDNLLNLSTHVAANYRITRGKRQKTNIKQYYLVVDEKFKKRFPIKEDLDST